jgi:predicted Zn finger-like uncharacterized protein
MLIVCPSCATSYMIDPASVGSAGRMVRCARCRATWFAGASSPVTAEPDVNTFVGGVIAEAEAQTAGSPETPAPSPLPEPVHPFTDEDLTAEPAEAEASVPAPKAIVDAPSLVPPMGQVEPAIEAEAESFALRRQRLQSRRKRARRSSRWTAVVLVLVAFNVALIGARSELVRFLPQTASLFAAIGLPVNLRHMRFEDVQITNESESGMPILIVTGTIVSESDKAVEVPRLRFAARDQDGREIYTWTMRPDKSVLGPGDRLAFRTRLASPPKEAHDVMVRFFTANDAMAGAQ